MGEKKPEPLDFVKDFQEYLTQQTHHVNMISGSVSGDKEAETLQGGELISGYRIRFWGNDCTVCIPDNDAAVVWKHFWESFSHHKRHVRTLVLIREWF